MLTANRAKRVFVQLMFSLTKKKPRGSQLVQHLPPIYADIEQGDKGFLFVSSFPRQKNQQNR